MKTIYGYERANGTIGIRNYVLVISMVHCANTAARKIAGAAGVPAIVHDYGCIEFQPKHTRTRLALLRAACSPNVFAAVLVGLGCEQTDHVSLMEEIRAAGKQVSYIGIQDMGDVDLAIRRGTELAEQYRRMAGAQVRTPVPVSKLVLGVQCGGSDWTTALAGNSVIGVMTDRIIELGGSVLISEVGGFPGSEHIIAERAETKAVGLEVLRMCEELRREHLALYGQTIEAVNPSPGNQAGGITTLVEKSMGNVKKMGVKARLKGLLYAGQTVPAPGLWLLDLRAEGPDSNTTTGFAMSGAHMTVFSTGRGTPLGSAVMPVVKLTGNPDCYERLRSVFDFNAGTVLSGESLEQAGKRLVETVFAVAEGTETKSEQNGNFEYLIPREEGRSICAG